MNSTQSTRAEIKARAKETLKGKYWYAFGVSILATLILGIVSGITSALSQSESYTVAVIASVISCVAVFLVTIPISLGLNRFYINAAKGGEPQVEDIFAIYKDNFGNAVLVSFLEALYVTLWSLLFIVPGIIKSYQYFMIDYMIAENPGMDRKRAFEITKAAMAGDKWKAFVLGLSFIGWILLCCVTLGIGIFFLEPYVSTTMAHYYLELRDKAIANGITTEEELNGVKII